jgi:hypothetical protein
MIPFTISDWLLKANGNNAKAIAMVTAQTTRTAVLFGAVSKDTESKTSFAACASF